MANKDYGEFISGSGTFTISVTEILDEKAANKVDKQVKAQKKELAEPIDIKIRYDDELQNLNKLRAAAKNTYQDMQDALSLEDGADRIARLSDKYSILNKQIADSESKVKSLEKELQSVETHLLKFPNGTLLDENETKAVRKYCNEMKKQMKDTYNEASVMQDAIELVWNIKDKKLEKLVGQFNSASKARNAVLKIMTGSNDVNTQKGRDAALRSLDEANYDRLVQQRAEEKKAAIKQQETELEKAWNHFASVALGAGAFKDKDNHEKARILKEFKKYGDTPEEIAEILDEAALRGIPKGTKFAHKYLNDYFKYVIEDIEKHDYLSSVKVGELNPASLIDTSIESSYTEEQVAAIQQEVKAYDELVAMKNKAYGIEPGVEKEVKGLDKLLKTAQTTKKEVKSATKAATKSAQSVEGAVAQVNPKKDWTIVEHLNNATESAKGLVEQILEIDEATKGIDKDVSSGFIKGLNGKDPSEEHKKLVVEGFEKIKEVKQQILDTPFVNTANEKRKLFMLNREYKKLSGVIASARVADYLPSDYAKIYGFSEQDAQLFMDMSDRNDEFGTSVFNSIQEYSSAARTEIANLKTQLKDVDPDLYASFNKAGYDNTRQQLLASTQAQVTAEKDLASSTEAVTAADKNQAKAIEQKAEATREVAKARGEEAASVEKIVKTQEQSTISQAEHVQELTSSYDGLADAVDDIETENNALERKLELLQEIAEQYGTDIKSNARKKQEEFENKDAEDGLTSKQADRLLELNEIIDEADANICELEENYDRIILKLANGKEVEILPDDNGLRNLYKIATEFYHGEFNGFDIEDIEFVEKQVEAIVNTGSDVASVYNSASESVRGLIDQYHTLRIESDEFAKSASGVKLGNFTNDDTAVGGYKYYMLAAYDEYKRVVQEIAAMPIVDTEDDKKRLRELQAEALRLSNTLSQANLSDGSVLNYKQMYGITDDDVAFDFMRKTRGDTDGIPLVKNIVEQDRKDMSKIWSEIADNDDNITKHMLANGELWAQFMEQRLQHLRTTVNHQQDLHVKLSAAANDAINKEQARLQQQQERHKLVVDFKKPFLEFWKYDIGNENTDNAFDGVIDGINDGTLTTLDQCIAKFEELSGVSMEALQNLTDNAKEEKELAELAEQQADRLHEIFDIAKANKDRDLKKDQPSGVDALRQRIDELQVLIPQLKELQDEVSQMGIQANDENFDAAFAAAGNLATAVKNKEADLRFYNSTLENTIKLEEFAAKALEKYGISTRSRKFGADVMSQFNDIRMFLQNGLSVNDALARLDDVMMSVAGVGAQLSMFDDMSQHSGQIEARPAEVPVVPLIEPGAVQTEVIESTGGEPVEIPVKPVVKNDTVTQKLSEQAPIEMPVAPVVTPETVQKPLQEVPTVEVPVVPVVEPVAPKIDEPIQSAVVGEQKLEASVESTNQDLIEQKKLAEDASNAIDAAGSKNQNSNKQKSLLDVLPEYSVLPLSDDGHIIENRIKNAFKVLRDAKDNANELFDLKEVFGGDDLVSQAQAMAHYIGNEADLSVGKLKLTSNDTVSVQLYNEKLKVTVDQIYKLIPASEEAAAHIALVGQSLEQNVKKFNENNFDTDGYRKNAKSMVDVVKSSLRGHQYDLTELYGLASSVQSTDDWKKFKLRLDTAKNDIKAKKQEAETGNTMDQLVSMNRVMSVAETNVKTMRGELEKLGDTGSDSFRKAAKALSDMENARLAYHKTDKFDEKIKHSNAYNDAKNEYAAYKALLSIEKQRQKAKEDAEKRNEKDEEQTYQRSITLQNQLYEAKKKYAAFVAKGDTESSGALKAKRELDDLKESYKASRELLTSEESRNKLHERELQLKKELKVTQKEQRQKIVDDTKKEEGNIAEQNRKKEQDALNKSISLQTQLYEAKKKYAALIAKGDTESADALKAKRTVDELKESYKVSRQLLTTEEARAKLREREKILKQELKTDTKEKRQKVADDVEREEDNARVQQVKKSYQEILDIVNKINSIDTNIIGLKKKNESGIYSGIIEQLQAEKEDLANKIPKIVNEFNGIGNEINVPVPVDFDYLGAFLNDARVQSALTTDEIDKLTAAFSNSQKIGVEAASEIASALKQITDISSKTGTLEGYVNKLNGVDGVVDSDISNNINKDSVAYKNASYTLEIYLNKLREFGGLDNAVNWTADQYNEIKKLSDECLKYANILDQAIEKENSYFRGKKQYKNGITIKDPMATDSGSMSEAERAAQSIQEQLQAIARNYAGDSTPIFTGFTQGADGISKLDFSVFDKATGSLRKFNIEMGSVTDNLSVTESTVKKNTAGFENAAKQWESIAALIQKVTEGSELGGDNNNFKNLKNIFDQLTDVLSDPSGDTSKLKKILEDAKLSTKEVEKLVHALQAVDNIENVSGDNKTLNKAINQMTSSAELLSRLNGMDIGGDNASVSKLKDIVTKLKTELSTNGGQNAGLLSQLTKDAKLASTEIEKLYKQHVQIQDLIDADPGAQVGTINPTGNVERQMIDLLKEVNNQAEITSVSFGQLNEKTNTLPYSVTYADGTVKNFTASMDALNGVVAQQQTGISKNATMWEKFGASLSGTAKQLANAFMGASVAYKAISELKKGYQYVKNIDLALTELKKVTDETEKSYSNFLQTASKTASVIGSTVTDFTNATADFARLGYTMNESAAMAEAAIVYKNVGEGIDDISTATESIISTMKAFGMESDSTMSIVDRFNEVANNFAISSVGIGDAMTRSASALNEAGNSIDESIGLITAANSVIQNPEQVGTALKTLALRLRGAKTELQEAGEDVDGMAESTSQLQAKLKALTHGKVDIMVDKDSFKNTTQILREMADAWEYMTDIERAAALELMGGKRQANILSSVIKNFDTVEQVIETSASSSGSALEENEKYLDSIDGKVQKLTNSMETLWMNTLDSELIKVFLELANAIVVVVNKVGLLTTVTAGAIGYFALFKQVTPVGLFNELKSSITFYSTAIHQLNALSQSAFNTQSVSSYAQAVSGLSAKQQALALANAGLNRQQIEEVLVKNQVNEATIQQIMSETSLASAKNLTTTATVAETIAVSTEAKAKLSEDAQNWLTANSSKKLTLALLQEAEQHGLVSKEVAAEIAVKQGLVATNQQATGAVASLWASFKAMPALGKIGVIVTAVTAVATVVGLVANKVKKSSKDIEEAFDDAIQKAKDAQKAFRNLKSSSSDIIPRFAELANGVDKFGQNVSLTDDEYKEFLSLNNQIAELFPEINMGMDSNGNAMLSLSYTADTLTQSLWDLVEAERAAQNQATADTMPSVLAGIDKHVDEYEDKKKNLQERLDYYEQAKDAINSYYSDANKQAFKDLYGDNWEEEWKFRAGNAGLTYALQMQEAFDAASNQDAWENLLEKFTIDGSIDWYKVINSEEMKNVIAGVETQVYNLQTRISKEWSQLNPVVTAWVNTDYTYNNLGSEMQSAVQAMVGNLDFENLAEQGYDTQESIQNYIKDYILLPIDSLAPSVQRQLSKLMSFSPNDLSLNEYINQVKSMAQNIADGSDGIFTFDDIMQKTGYKDLLNDYESTAKNILEILDDNIPKYYDEYTKGTTAHFNALGRYEKEVGILKDKIYSLSADDVTKSFDIIKKYGINTWDELVKALESKTFDVVVDLDTESDGMESLLAAIDESVSATGLSSESIANLKKRYQELADQGYDVEAMFEETTNGIHLNAQALRELEAAYTKHNKSDIDKKLEGLVDHYNNLTIQIEECSDASERALLYAQRSNVIDQINDTATLAAQYAGLTSAYNQWQKAQSGGTERDMYEGVLSGKKEVDEELSRGWVDEGTRAYLELLSGKDLSTAKYDELLATYKELNKAVNSSGYSVNDFFTADSDGNATSNGIFNFLDAVKVAQKKFGQEWVKLNKDGSYTFDFGSALFSEDGIEYAGDAAIAKALGISEELVQIILRAAQDAGFEVNLDSAYSALADFKDEVSTVNDRLKELGATEYTFNINSTNINDVENQIEEAQKALNNLTNEDGTIKVNVSEEDYQNAQTLLATLIYQKQTLDDAAVLHVDTTNAESGVEFIVKKLQEFKAAYNDFEVKAAIGADTAESEKNMHEAIVALQGTSPEIRTALGIDLNRSNAEINTAINNITVDKLIEVGVDPTLVDSYVASEHSTTGEVVWSNNIDQVTAWMNKKHVTPGTVNWENNLKKIPTYFNRTGYINWVNSSDEDNSGDSSDSGDTNVYGNAFANGSIGAEKTETSLVGELGPEILVRNGRWTTVGANGAEFTQVKKGDIIFNHKQTEQLLKNGRIAGRGKAYSEGAGPGRFTVGSSSIKSSSSSSSSDEMFDWIEIRIEEISETISLGMAKIENAVGANNKNFIIDEMLELNKKLYDNLIAGANEYYSYAKTLLAKIPAEYREAAQNGAIAIEDFAGDANKETKEAIEEYREWVQKGADATQQAEETLTEISNLAKQAIDNISQDFENKRSLTDDQIEQLEAYNSLLETTKGFESENIYQEMIDANNKNIKQLEEQRNKMQKELNEQVEAGNIKVDSQDWYDAVNAIAEVDTEIINLKVDTEDYQDTINELHWDKFDALLKRIELVSDETENLIDILSNEDMVDDNGNWTNEGITTLGLYAQQMEVAEVQAKKYQEEIDYLNENWKDLGYTEEEYIEKLGELKDGQYDAIKSYHDAKDAIVDLNKERIDAIKEGIEKEIDAYAELIEKKKELLDSEKDLYDFQKSIKKQEKDIADIERQLAALASDNSASARAKKAQLQAELAEAQAELADSYYERSVQNQQDALDKELENFQDTKDKEIEGWEDYLENTEQVVSDSLATVQANTSTVYQTLQEMGQEYSLSITESITSPWKEGEYAIQSFAEQFGISMSATVDELKALEQEFKQVMSEIEQAGVNAVDAVADNADKYTEAEYKEPEVKQESNKQENNQKEEPKPSLTKGSYVEVKPGAKWYGNSSGGGSWGYAKAGTIKYINEGSSHPYNINGAGWVRKQDIKGYKHGTSGVNKDQLAWIDEMGLEELVLHAGPDGRLEYLTKGTSVIPSKITDNLMELGQLDPSSILDQNRPQITAHHVVNNEISINMDIAEVVHIDTVTNDTIPDLTKAIQKQMDNYMVKLNNAIKSKVR